MSGERDPSDSCAGLSVHVSCLRDQQWVSTPPETDSTLPDEGVTQETPQPLPFSHDKTPQPGFSNPTLQPGHHADLVFNLDKWVLDLNQSLLEHHGNQPASISLLTRARQVCDDHIKRLTDDYHTQSENHLKSLLKKPSTKKQKKKTLRLFDPDLRAVNEKVGEVMLVRQQLDSRLKHLLSGSQQQVLEQKHHQQQQQQQQFSPIQMPAELKAKGRRPEKSGFCQDLMLCVLLSCLVMALVTFVSALF